MPSSRYKSLKKLKRVVPFALLLCAHASAPAQPAVLKGFVSDQTNGEAMELVNVTLTGESGAPTMGAVTDGDGLYIFPRIVAGVYVFRASFLGYGALVDTLVLAAGEVLTYNVRLAPREATLDEIVVEAEDGSGAALITAGLQTVRPEDIQLIPGPDLSGDLAALMTALPGVVAIGDRGGQFFVRGGEPSQNLVQIDGILLYQPFHILGFYSAFPSEIMQRTEIYAGGFTSRYGERLSSVIEVSTRNGNDREINGSATLSPFVSAVSLEGPIARNSWSYLGSFRQSVVRRAGKYVLDTPLPFQFGDAFVKVHGKMTKNSRLSAVMLNTHDRGELGVEVENRAPDEIGWRNFALGGRLLTLPQLTPVTIDLRAAYSSFDTDMGPAEQPDRTSSISRLHFSADATFFGAASTVDAGVSASVISMKSVLGGLYQNIDVKEEKIEHVAVYVEPEYRIGDGLKIRPGLRVQFFDIRFNPFLEPRLRVVWERGKHQFSGALGSYHQAILGLNDRRDAANVFTVWTNVPRPTSESTDVRAGKAQQALHAILGYRFSPFSGLDVSIEAYKKRLTNLFIAEWTAYPRFTTNLQPGTGQTTGFDIRLEGRLSSFYGYVNYGYSATTYEAGQASLILWYGQETLKFNPPHDRRHQLNVLLNASTKHFDASIRWSFGSGLPFSQAAGFDGFVLIDDLLYIPTAPKSRRVIYERPFNARLPTFHRLDFSVSHTFSFERVDLTIQASAINIYDRRNVFFLDVFTLRRVDQLPFFPSVGVKLEF